MISKRDRNNITAKMDMLNAVKTALMKYGFAKLGINVVSEEASMDKSAIYRYYGDFEGLLSAYIEKQDYWLQSIQQYTTKDRITKDLAKKMFREQYDTLYKNQELQELIRWELADKSNISAPITVKREIYSQELLSQSRKVLDNCGVNFNFVLSILLGGIYYAILHKEKGPFCEVDLLLKKHKDELIKTIDWLIDLLFDTNEMRGKYKMIALNAQKEGNSIDSISRILDITVGEVKELLKE